MLGGGFQSISSKFLIFEKIVDKHLKMGCKI
jgi:hypothetical protein